MIAIHASFDCHLPAGERGFLVRSVFSIFRTASLTEIFEASLAFLRIHINDASACLRGSHGARCIRRTYTSVVSFRAYPEQGSDTQTGLLPGAGVIHAGSAIPDRADRGPQDPVQGPGEQGQADRRPDLLLGPACSLGDGLGYRTANLPGQTGQGGFAQRGDDRVLLRSLRLRWHTSAIPVVVGSNHRFVLRAGNPSPHAPVACQPVKLSRSDQTSTIACATRHPTWVFQQMHAVLIARPEVE